MTLSKNPWYCADIIRAAKPDFTPRVAFILGSGLGALADQIDDAVSLSYEKLPGFPVSTVHGHAGELGRCCFAPRRLAQCARKFCRGAWLP